VTRGRRPDTAITAAKNLAFALGYEIVSTFPRGYAYDFVARKDEAHTLVRVRRIKHNHFAVPDIEYDCAHEIAGLRGALFTGNASRELWIWGRSRTCHRYLVLPDQVEEVSGKSGWAGQQPLVGG
jgi:hypothetical protein